MPNWKKVAVSGSAASFLSLSVDTSITASTINASEIAVDGSLQVTGSTTLSGSVGTTVFSSNIDTMILTGSLVVTGSIQATGSLEVQGGITGSLFGIASQAVSSSYALSASYTPGSGTSVSASYAETASYVNLLDQDVFITGTLSIDGPIIITNGSNIYGTASQAVSSSYAVSASYAPGSGTSVSSSYALSASYANNANSSSYALSASYALTASDAIQAQTASYINHLIQDVSITGSLSITGSTTQIGNNTLLGNTTLSGSIIMSGSKGQPNPTISIFGDLNQTGYTRYLPVTNNINNSISASYIFVSGSTQDLYFAQNSKGYANATRLRWIEGNLYTGLLNGGVITTSSSTVYNVSSGSGIIVNLNASLNDNPYPTIQYLNWGNLSQSIAPLSASYDQAFVGIDSTGNIFQQGSPFSDGQYDALINIGLVLFQNHSTINGVKTQPSVAYGFQQAQNIFNRAFGPLKLSGYTVAVSGSSTGSIVLGSGTAYAPGSNYAVDPNNPYYTVDAGTNTSKFFRYYQSGSGVNPFVYLTNNGAGYPNLDPVYYNNNGTLDTVGTSNYSLQRLFWYPNSVTKAVVAYYGNARYGTMSEAIANLNIEPFVEAPNTAASAIYLGAYAIKGGTNTSLQNPAHFTWIPGGLFRSVGGSGGGGSIVTQTLSGLSDVSIAGQTNGQPLVWSSTAGKWINGTYISASVAGNATSATSASYASTSSWALNAINASTASYVTNAVSSSYALTASYVSMIPDQGFQFTQSPGSTTWNIIHNLNTFTPLVDTYDSSYNQLIPAGVVSIDANTTQISFSTSQSGYAILSRGSGVSSQTVVSASYATTASYATSVGFNFEQITPSNSWTINHNLNNQHPLVQIYDSNHITFIPQSISGSSANTVIVTFSANVTGYARVV
jgi:hypothetical protein